MTTELFPLPLGDLPTRSIDSHDLATPSRARDRRPSRRCRISVRRNACEVGEQRLCRQLSRFDRRLKRHMGCRSKYRCSGGTTASRTNGSSAPPWFHRQSCDARPCRWRAATNASYPRSGRLWIRSTQPDVVLAHDPWKRYRLHPDHRNAGWLALDGIVAARDPHYFRHHGLDVHRPETALLFEADEPDHVEDITGFVDAKVDALLAHVSQFITTHLIPTDDDGTAVEAFGKRVRDHAEAVGSITGVARGEAFKILSNL